MRDVINATDGSNWFTIIDLKEAYYYIEIEECDRHKIAFEFKNKVYEWKGTQWGSKMDL